jgi:hypothetical protein
MQASSGEFVSPLTDIKLDFNFPVGGHYQNLRLTAWGQGEISLYRVGYTPRSLEEQFSRPVIHEPGEVTRNEGTGNTRFLNLDNQPRYGCSSDGKFLTTGDGIVDDLSGFPIFGISGSSLCYEHVAKVKKSLN